MKLSSENAFNLDKAKILSPCKKLLFIQLMNIKHGLLMETYLNLKHDKSPI